jgi:hypothetical protein
LMTCAGSDWNNLLQCPGCKPSDIVSMLGSVVTRRVTGEVVEAEAVAGSSVEESEGGGGLGMMWISVASHRRMASGGWVLRVTCDV